jgi:hypothetical protein
MITLNIISLHLLDQEFQDKPRLLHIIHVILIVVQRILKVRIIEGQLSMSELTVKTEEVGLGVKEEGSHLITDMSHIHVMTHTQTLMVVDQVLHR